MFEMKDMMLKARKMQKDMKKQQKALAKQLFEASSGGGMVKVRMNGKQEVLAVEIDPTVVQSGDVKMLQDLIKSAMNEVGRKVGDATKSSMSQAMGDMDMGAMGKMLGM